MCLGWLWDGGERLSLFDPVSHKVFYSRVVKFNEKQTGVENTQ